MERTVEFDQPVLTDETAEALREATERAERAEAELAKLKAQQQHTRPAAAPHSAPHNAASSQTHPPASGSQDASEPHATRQQNSVHQDEESAYSANQDAVYTEDLKLPPSPNTAANAPDGYPGTPVYDRGSANRAMAQHDGVDELRKDPMMAHLLDSLDAGTDIGHYGRLVFAMVARHFLPHEEVIDWMTRDSDFTADEAQQMLHQVEGRDYSPPRRERLLEWQSEQEFIFIDASDPDSGNLYRNLKFPQEIYQHIGHYQDAKAHH